MTEQLDQRVREFLQDDNRHNDREAYLAALSALSLLAVRDCEQVRVYGPGPLTITPADISSPPMPPATAAIHDAARMTAAREQAPHLGQERFHPPVALR